MVCRLECVSELPGGWIKAQITGLYSQSFWFSRTGVGPEDLHSYRLPVTWECWCWYRGHTLRTTNVENFPHVFAIYAPSFCNSILVFLWGSSPPPFSDHVFGYTWHPSPSTLHSKDWSLTWAQPVSQSVTGTDSNFTHVPILAKEHKPWELSKKSWDGSNLVPQDFYVGGISKWAWSSWRPSGHKHIGRSCLRIKSTWRKEIREPETEMRDKEWQKNRQVGGEVLMILSE